MKKSSPSLPCCQLALMVCLLVSSLNAVCVAQSGNINNTTANNTEWSVSDYMRKSNVPASIAAELGLKTPNSILGVKSDLEAIPLPIPSDGMMIPYDQGVSPTGALTIQVPIETYNNAAGISPSVSLSYNSQNSGLSNTGYKGWTLNMGSLISRTRKSVYYDGIEKPIEHSTADKLVLDGTRLIESETQNISGCILYELVNNANVKVKAFVQGNDFRYFDVFYPNGIIMRLGDSTLMESKLIFPVKKLTYPNGEQIKYKYAYSQYQIPGSTVIYKSALPRLVSITYNEKVVQFEYINIPKQANYRDGYMILNDKALSAVIDSTFQIKYRIDSTKL